jgi:hypothetical protein
VAPRDANLGMANVAAVLSTDHAGIRMKAFRSVPEAQGWLENSPCRMISGQ